MMNFDLVIQWETREKDVFYTVKGGVELNFIVFSSSFAPSKNHTYSNEY